jgi:hypothetical protein
MYRQRMEECRRLAESGPKWSAAFKTQVVLWVMLIAESSGQIAKQSSGVPAATGRAFAAVSSVVSIICGCLLVYWIFKGYEQARSWNRREIRVLIPLTLGGITLAAYAGYLFFRG